ncbi:MAG: glycosyltransferase, partial [Bdellovibrionales bacterium]|nr:glycosyltransferase [Bdellovibrionales bacterium]
NKSSEFYDVFAQAGLSVERVPSSPLKFSLKALRYLITRCSEDEIHVVQSHGYKAHFYCFFLKVLARKKWVAVNHGFTAENFKVRCYHFLDRMFVPAADIAICVSRPLFALFVKLRGNQKPTVYIPNAVDKNALVREGSAAEIRAAAHCGPGSILLGVFGRFSYEKGQDLAFEAFQRLADTHDELRLVFVGDGGDRAIIEEKVNSVGLATKVLFAGYRQ